MSQLMPATVLAIFVYIEMIVVNVTTLQTLATMWGCSLMCICHSIIILNIVAQQFTTVRAMPLENRCPAVLFVLVISLGQRLLWCSFMHVICRGQL